MRKLAPASVVGSIGGELGTPGQSFGPYSYQLCSCRRLDSEPLTILSAEAVVKVEQGGRIASRCATGRCKVTGLKTRHRAGRCSDRCRGAGRSITDDRAVCFARASLGGWDDLVRRGWCTERGDREDSEEREDRGEKHVDWVDGLCCGVIGECEGDKERVEKSVGSIDSDQHRRSIWV